MIPIFLSASIPLPDRNTRYFETVDVIAIRDCIRALATAIIPAGKLVFGGHPAITPMIRLIIKNRGSSVRDHFMLYQSRFFSSEFPPDNKDFEHVVLVDAGLNRSDSLKRMRIAMIRAEDFAAAIFVGGMEGVEEEYNIFRELHPAAPAYPIASTGAAAKLLFEHHSPRIEELVSNLKYLSLFRRLLRL